MSHLYICSSFFLFFPPSRFRLISCLLFNFLCFDLLYRMLAVISVSQWFFFSHPALDFNFMSTCAPPPPHYPPPPSPESLQGVWGWGWGVETLDLPLFSVGGRGCYSKCTCVYTTFFLQVLCALWFLNCIFDSMKNASLHTYWSVLGRLAGVAQKL